MSKGKVIGLLETFDSPHEGTIIKKETQLNIITAPTDEQKSAMQNSIFQYLVAKDFTDEFAQLFASSMMNEIIFAGASSKTTSYIQYHNDFAKFKYLFIHENGEGTSTTFVQDGKLYTGQEEFTVNDNVESNIEEYIQRIIDKQEGDSMILWLDEFYLSISGAKKTKQKLDITFNTAKFSSKMLILSRDLPDSAVTFKNYEMICELDNNGKVQSNEIDLNLTIDYAQGLAKTIGPVPPFPYEMELKVRTEIIPVFPIVTITKQSYLNRVLNSLADF
jgi:hypothetical protein